MPDRNAICVLWAVLLVFFTGSVCEAVPKIFVVSPNTFRLNVSETVSILLLDPSSNAPQKFKVSLRDHPGERKEFSISEFSVSPGETKTVYVKVTDQDVPDLAFSDPKAKQYVALHVTGPGTFSRKSLILVSPAGGYYFLQTTKPIYKPNENVPIRVIPLDERLRPSFGTFKLTIVNPQGTTVEEIPSTILNQEGIKPFFTHVFRVPSYPLFGQWMVVLKYGRDFQLNSTVHFTVEEYVLPTFSVKIKSPEVILEVNDDVSGELIAEHTYGKKVKGTAVFRFGVKNEAGTVIYIGKSLNKELFNGKASYKFDTTYFKNDSRIGWFPKIAGNRLVVEGTVIEFATGKKETQVDDKALFTTSPYSISFKNCIQTFKAGLNTIVSVDVTYSGSGRPAEDVPIHITATDQKNRRIRLQDMSRNTDENGQVDFRLSTATDHETIHVQVRSGDGKYEAKFQATGSITLKKYIAPANAYVSVTKLERKDPQKGPAIDRFSTTVFAHPTDQINDIYYLVIARGSVLKMGHLDSGKFHQRAINFDITAEMSPRARLVVFAVHNNNLLADSVVLEVQNACSKEITIKPEFELKEPGREGTIKIKGTQGTWIGLLAVDEAVYALKDNDLLKREKFFKTMAAHDLGCGPGGGTNTDEVLGHAGVVIMSSEHTAENKQRTDYSCGELRRKKRELASTLLAPYNDRQKACCKLGFFPDKYKRSCEDRATIILDFFEHKDEDGCATAFLDCCRRIQMQSVSDDRARTVGSNEHLEFDFDHIDESNEGNVLVRQDFREVFAFEDVEIGPANKTEVVVSLPHSITTWVFHAFGVSRQHGMCVAESKNVVVFQKFFLQVNVPYSVVRNEQIEIPATVYNYYSQPVHVRLSMYGVKGICSEAKPNQKTRPTFLKIPGYSAQTVTFPVVPLEVGIFKIRIVALTIEGGDVIVKDLRVIPEGRLVEKDISIPLDPRNQQKRSKKDLHKKSREFTDSIDAEQGKQVSVIDFPTDESIIPGTETCVISLVGDSFGPVVETTIENVEGLLQLPRGCGEQNMMFMAPTLYTFQYLKITGRVTAEIEKKAYDYLRKGYQNELNFRKTDGSYSAFQARPSSTWLTAFVMKVFCQASKHIFIDNEVINSGLNWLANNQNPDGSFIDKHPVVHWDMTGGVKGATTMTAFVLITLKECSTENQILEMVAVRAQTYLENKYRDITNPYEMAVVTYALSLAESEGTEEANRRLHSLSIYNEGENLRYWVDSSNSRAIETSSYALLAQLQLRQLENALPIVNWLNTKRTFQGGFPSTQDTTIGLQALSEYAIQSRNPEVNLVCNVTTSTDSSFSQSFAFRKDNSHVLQRREIPRPGDKLFVKTEGNGVGMLNIKYKYNVLEKEDICRFDVKVDVLDAIEEVPIVPPAEKEENPFADIFADDMQDLIRKLEAVPLAFNQDNAGIELVQEDLARSRIGRSVPVAAVPERQRIGGSKQRWRIKVCAKYEADHDSNMAIIDVAILTGFSPIKEDISKIVETEDTPVSRYEISGKNVVFYLDKISHQEPVCISFRIIQDFIVGNMQAATVKVYDYYKPEDVCTEFYSPNKNSPLLRTICEGQVCECAEGGCPSSKIFEEVSNVIEESGRNSAERKLLVAACTNYSYVWIVTPKEKSVKNGFRYIKFQVVRVVKEGVEEREELEGEIREFMATENCQNTDLDVGDNKKYFLMGQDGYRYQNKITGKLWYRYMLDQGAALHEWHKSARDARNRDLQKVFHSVGKAMRTKGCHD